VWGYSPIGLRIHCLTYGRAVIADFVIEHLPSLRHPLGSRAAARPDRLGLAGNCPMVPAVCGYGACQWPQHPVGGRIVRLWATTRNGQKFSRVLVSGRPSRNWPHLSVMIALSKGETPFIRHAGVAQYGLSIRMCE
jgi:hypothetical protein